MYHLLPHYVRYFAVKHAVLKIVSAVTQDTDFIRARFTLKTLTFHGTPVKVTSFTVYPVPIFTTLIAQQHYVQIFDIEFRPKRTTTVESNSRNSFKPLCKARTSPHRVSRNSELLNELNRNLAQNFTEIGPEYGGRTGRN